MKKQDYLHTDASGYKLHVVSMVPAKPKRLLLIPPLVGATGVLAIRTFRYFLRGGCHIMSFDYCGHYKDTKNKFTLNGTFADTKVALFHALEHSKQNKIPMHVAGACYGLIPLMQVLNEIKWPKEIKSMFSVSGLLNIYSLMNFDNFKLYLKKRGLSFDTKAEFVDFIKNNENAFINDKQKYIGALTEYFLTLFEELADIISQESFGVLKYSNADYCKTFYEFITINLPKVIVPTNFPCLFFYGIHDKILNFKYKGENNVYLKSAEEVAPHGEFCKIKIDHFGRGEDHYVIGEKGMEFIIANE